MAEDEGLTLRISKLDAAKRQLRTAITMWFYDDDPVSTHTLAVAAYEIIHAVSKARDPNRPELLFDSTQVREDKRREFKDLLREAANFFKHGDRDPHALIEFAPGLTYIFFFYAVCGLELCGESLLTEFMLFRQWFQVAHPELLSEKVIEEIERRTTIDALAQLRALPKKEFFQTGMRALRNRQV
jgi:hypothetical protein